MQVKTIKKNIQSKLEEWLKTITDEALAKDVKENLLVSGGSITSMFLNEPVNDYDIYLMDIDVCKRLAKYYTQTFQDVVIFDGREKQKLVDKYNDENDTIDGTLPIDRNNSFAISLRNLKYDQIKLYFNGENGGMKVNDGIEEDKLNYTPLYFSPNAISLSHNLQIVLRFWGTAEQIHKTFDYIHATNYFTFKEGLVRNLEAVESILTKQLKYQGSYYPVTSIIRAKKFIKRGFNIGAGELLKIMFQISQLDLTNPDVLEEQLIGVDVAYFDLIITALRNKMDSDKDFKLSAEYFNNLIDIVFNSTEDVEG
jgi:hypothetical protein